MYRCRRLCLCLCLGISAYVSRKYLCVLKDTTKIYLLYSFDKRINFFKNLVSLQFKIASNLLNKRVINQKKRGRKKWTIYFFFFFFVYFYSAIILLILAKKKIHAFLLNYIYILFFFFFEICWPVLIGTKIFSCFLHNVDIYCNAFPLLLTFFLNIKCHRLNADTVNWSSGEMFRLVNIIKLHFWLICWFIYTFGSSYLAVVYSILQTNSFDTLL